MPDDVFAEAGTVARRAVSLCDVEELCVGGTSAIGPDVVAPTTKVVWPATSASGCDPEETCSGSDVTLPVDVNHCVKVGLKVLGQSGKFTIYDLEAGETDERAVTVTIDALREVDAAGDSVGTSGNSKHSINTFAAQDFTIVPAVDVMLGRNYTVPAKKISFQTPIGDIGRLKVDTFILTAGGIVGAPGDDWGARANDLKWNVELSDWSWCGEAASCTSGQTVQVGEYVDVDIAIKGKNQPVQSPGDDKKFALGAGVDLNLSDQVLVDGAWVTMPTGYPMVAVKGANTIFTFRFPKFSTNAVYDPLVGTSSIVLKATCGTMDVCGEGMVADPERATTECSGEMCTADDIAACCVAAPCSASTDCNGHGTTTDDDKTDGCDCSCAGGFSGADCAVPPPCDYSDCNGHGTTNDSDKTDGCTCSCTGGWTGSSCRVEPAAASPCDASDCNNHGTTTDSDASDGCACSCTGGYSGATCTTLPIVNSSGSTDETLEDGGTVTACDAATDCNNHGTTSDEDRSDGCVCVCSSGYMGADCGQSSGGAASPCDAERHCNGNGTTTDEDSSDGCKCACNNGFSGETCLLQFLDNGATALYLSATTTFVVLLAATAA